MVPRTALVGGAQGARLYANITLRGFGLVLSGGVGRALAGSRCSGLHPARRGGLSGWSALLRLISGDAPALGPAGPRMPAVWLE